MENNSKFNRSIAKFMGWEVIVSPVEEKFPNQEWHYAKNLSQGSWDSGACVHLDSLELDKEREIVDEKAWSNLCDKSYSRCGDYATSWNALMPVLKKILQTESDINRTDILAGLTALDIASTYEAVGRFVTQLQSEKSIPQIKK